MSSSEGLSHRPGLADPTSPSKASETASPPGEGTSENFGVDFVIKFRYSNEEWKTVILEYERLIASLQGVGLQCQVRPGEEQYFLVFVKAASSEKLLTEIYRSREREQIYGVRTTSLERNMSLDVANEPCYESEKLRIVYEMITLPPSEGGAGICPGTPQWPHVEDIFPLHDHEANIEFLKRVSKKYFLSQWDLNVIRYRFGERVALYFAFAQCYFTFLLIPGVFGLGAYFILEQFSPIYALFNCFWCVVFVEYWRQYEADLATIWGVKGVSKLSRKRRDFVPSADSIDTATGERGKSFPFQRRLLRQTLQVPFALISTLLLGSVIAGCFAIEIFLSEIYEGPLKNILVFLPTAILVAGLAVAKGFASMLATRLTDFENYETDAAYQSALTAKLFVVDFIVSYLPICLTAFVYFPFASVIVPYLDVLSLTTAEKAIRGFEGTSEPADLHHVSPQSQFKVNPKRLQTQVFYFTVTAQIVHLMVSFVLPYIKRQGARKLKTIKNSPKPANAPLVSASPGVRGESEFLDRVRNQAGLGTYDPADDFREMVIQFGYLSLFSVVWPLTSCSFLLRDWIELRADAAKICVEMKRPIPWRAESIGPWIGALELISWIGSITSVALVYMFSNNGVGSDGTMKPISTWKLSLAIVLAEHGYFLVQAFVRTAIRQMDFPGRKEERRQQHLAEKLILAGSQQSKGSLAWTDAGSFASQIRDPGHTSHLFRPNDRVQTEGDSHGTSTGHDWSQQHSLGTTLPLQAVETIGSEFWDQTSSLRNADFVVEAGRALIQDHFRSQAPDSE